MWAVQKCSRKTQVSVYGYEPNVEKHNWISENFDLLLNLEASEVHPLGILSAWRKFHANSCLKMLQSCNRREENGTNITFENFTLHLRCVGMTRIGFYSPISMKSHLILLSGLSVLALLSSESHCLHWGLKKKWKDSQVALRKSLNQYFLINFLPVYS